jgi:hypothetical protein
VRACVVDEKFLTERENVARRRALNYDLPENMNEGRRLKRFNWSEKFLLKTELDTGSNYHCAPSQKLYLRNNIYK